MVTEEVAVMVTSEVYILAAGEVDFTGMDEPVIILVIATPGVEYLAIVMLLELVILVLLELVIVMLLELVIVTPGAEELDIWPLWSEGLVILPTRMEVLSIIRPRGL